MIDDKTIIKISEDESGERLDVFLSDFFPEVSRSGVQKIISAGKVLVNGQNQKNSYKLKENDFVEFYSVDENTNLVAEQFPLDIRYEDDDLLVINKPKNMLTHPTSKEKTGTLVNVLLGYGCSLSNLNGEMRAGIVHRLDRNTTGLLLVAKNNRAHEYLANQIKQREITKKYLAVVHGVVKDDEGEIDAPIARNPKYPEKMCILEGGKPSITKYKVLERFENQTFLELELITGRTHQIRVHLLHIGHPIVNDSLYTNAKVKAKTVEQVLQSYRLTFKRPSDNNIITIEIPYDESLEKVLRYLRSKQ